VDLAQLDNELPAAANDAQSAFRMIATVAAIDID
jgi:hypothetical protein